MNDEQQPQRPASDDRDAWRAHWIALGMPWRTEPQIGVDRQRFLAERRSVSPDVERGIYPFRDENGSITLARADVEWLLATHGSGGVRGPVEWSDERQRERAGLDLRGAWLRNADLSGLPLARTLGGLGRPARENATAEQRDAAAIHLERVNLYDAHLEDAVLSDAHLEGATLGGTFGHRTHLELAKLVEAHLEGADCSYARLDGAAMRAVHLEGATLYRTHLDHTELREAQLGGAQFTRAHFGGALLGDASFAGKVLSTADLARLHAAGVFLPQQLPPADLREAFFDPATSLIGVSLGTPESGYVSLVDVRWNDVNLAVVEWTRTRRGLLRTRIEVLELGDEREARTAKGRDGTPKPALTRIAEYRAAVRANRQLATVLRAEGLNEDADRFAYTAQRLQRQVYRRQGRRSAALGSWLLDAVSGYGYRPVRSLLAYVAIVLAFATLYLLNGQFASPHLRWDEAIVLSVSSFHGRGFFTTGVSLSDTLARLAAAEAIIGLLIEITFIATFTQRFFAR